MPISSRRQPRGGLNIWPGFVDALSQLLMVIVFVLLIFTAGQFYLSDALSGRDAALRKLTAQINQLTDILALERQSNAALKVNVTQLTTALQGMTAQRDALATQLKDVTAKANAAEQQLQTALVAEKEATAAAQKKAAANGAALTTAQATVNDLNAQIQNLKNELARIAAALDASEAKSQQQQVQIADLGRRLNQALASKVEQLARFRSEFFGRLRELLGNRPDIRIIGDRFVFQSEVLFAPGDATLSDTAKQRLVPVATALKAIAAKIPPNLPWILEVQGYTDKNPINTAQYPSNWVLSTARALSVVRYLAQLGIPPNRLAAAGFGQYQPVDTADTPEAYRLNRRIELKLTAP